MSLQTAPILGRKEVCGLVLRTLMPAVELVRLVQSYMDRELCLVVTDQTCMRTYDLSGLLFWSGGKPSASTFDSNSSSSSAGPVGSSSSSSSSGKQNQKAVPSRAPAARAAASASASQGKSAPSTSPVGRAEYEVPSLRAFRVIQAVQELGRVQALVTLPDGRLLSSGNDSAL